jgi:hypothetical protein
MTTNYLVHLRHMALRAQYYANVAKLRTISMPQYYALAKESFEFWQVNGFTDFEALGIVANEDAESSFISSAVGDNGTAFGNFQWHDDRCALILNGNDKIAGCGINVKTDFVHAHQLQACLFELNNFETHALAMLKVTTNAYDAAASFCNYFERAGSPNAMNVRGAKAVKWAAYFGVKNNVGGPRTS